MIKIIKIEYFDQFKCIMDKCPENCCGDWSISVDDETYNKWMDLEIPDLEMKVSNEIPHTIINKTGVCPFLTSNGLCSIHKDYGEEFLSNTCKSYPRFVSEYNNLFIENIGLSCPAAAEMLVCLDKKCKLTEQVYYENNDEINKVYVAAEVELIMKSIVNHFYEQDYIIDSIKKCFNMFGIEEDVLLDSVFAKKNSLLLQNISICYSFERIMLQSKKENPDYVAVIERLCLILRQFEEKCREISGNGSTLTDECILTEEQLANALYKIMRTYDHEI